MNSASILMNVTAVTPVAGATDALPADAPGFDQALAAAQAGVEPVALVMAGEPLAPAAEPEKPESDGDASEASAAVVLAQMLAGSSQPARAEEPTAAVEEPQVPAAPKPTMSATRGPVPREAEGDEGDDSSAGRSPPLAADPDVAPLRASTTLERTPETAASGTGLPPAPAPQPGGSAQAVVQAAASALRDAAPTNASAMAAPGPAPGHATLREPVGTARWADELGNRLVLMSVRGQQQGSLTLTPEHLGPVEVQISVNRDTANVWFGAQHADTRAALAEAMPRLRELLASSGLSLGQSGVSEQAPRQGFAAPVSRTGGDLAAPDVAAVEAPAPVWRAWRPGLIDTYA